MSNINHLQQPDLFGLNSEEEQGIAKAVDALREKGKPEFTHAERIGITLAEERIRNERNRRKALGFPIDAPRDEGLFRLTNEVCKAWRKDISQVLK